MKTVIKIIAAIAVIALFVGGYSYITKYMEGKEFDEVPLAKVFSSQEEADADAAIRKFEGVYGILNEDNTITPMTDEQIAQYGEAASCAVNLILDCNNRDYRATDGTEGYEYFTKEAQEELYAIGDPEATIEMY